jgi:ABC-type uncharacterized transport system permease subunit
MTLYAALAAYALGTLAALLSLGVRSRRLQYAGLALMVGGWVAHTIWIGTICAKTGHPPLTNLAEAASFVAWTVFVVELALWIRYRVYAASFFVYPLVLFLLTLSAVVGENFATLDPSLRSNLFIGHLLLTTVGIAALLIGLAFNVLAYLQDRALKSKHRGPTWDWIPSLELCKKIGYGSLAIGFGIYTFGLIAGVLWSYRTNAGFLNASTKTIGAIAAWILFGALLQQFVAGTYRSKRTVAIGACALVAVLVAMLGIRG